MTRPALFAVLVSALTFSAVSAESPVISDPSEMKELFNGTDLTGWSGDERMWSVRDGVIHGETTAEIAAKGNTFLIWRDGKTEDFELHVTFRCNAINNSGIQYRSEHLTGDSAPNAWVLKGYQHELRNEQDFPNVAGFIYGERLNRGRLCLAGEKAVTKDGKKEVLANLITAEEFKELFRLDDWNDVVILAKGNHIQHYMNGRLILDFTDADPDQALLTGNLGLQLHAGKPMWAEFKNIRFKAL